MSPATSRASAKYRRKKLDENPSEFRAKEALRLKNYRARVKEKQRHSLRPRVEEDSRVVQDENKLSDDVDAWLYDAVEEGYSLTRHSERSSRFSLTRFSSPSQSSSDSDSESLHNDDETLLTPCSSTMVTFHDASKFLVNGEKTLHEWDKRWRTIASFSHCSAHAVPGTGVVKVPADRARGELLDMVRKGREALLQVESVAFIDLSSIQIDEFRDLWIRTIRVVGGLCERVTRADVVLQLHLDMRTV